MRMMRVAEDGEVDGKDGRDEEEVEVEEKSEELIEFEVMNNCENKLVYIRCELVTCRDLKIS